MNYVWRISLAPAVVLATLALLLMSWGSTSSTPAPGWTLSWSDEFNGRDGSSPDPSKWVVETGGNGFGNRELEYYTSRPQNVQIKGGSLVITVAKETYTGPDRVTRSYTSARLKTKGKFDQAYGRFEARIKIPRGQGMWPAFWMLGNDFDQAGWPGCGEIDIMENIGKEPAIVHGTIHGPGYSKIVIGEDFVSAEEGTGVVHMAPAFGADDFARIHPGGALGRRLAHHPDLLGELGEVRVVHPLDRLRDAELLQREAHRNQDLLHLLVGDAEHDHVVRIVRHGRDLAGLVGNACAFRQPGGNALVELLAVQNVHHPPRQGGGECLPLRQHDEDSQQPIGGHHVADAFLER